VKKMKGDAEAWIFYIDMRSAGRRFEEFYHHTQEKGVNYVRGKVAEIIPKPDGTLMVQYEDTNLGRKGREIFDMVVLCPALIPPPGQRKLRINWACLLAMTGLSRKSMSSLIL